MSKPNTLHELLLSQGYRLESMRPNFTDPETGEVDFFRRYYNPCPPEGLGAWHRVLNSKADLTLLGGEI